MMAQRIDVSETNQIPDAIDAHSRQRKQGGKSATAYERQLYRNSTFSLKREDISSSKVSII